MAEPIQTGIHQTDLKAIHTWLDSFAAAVRNKDCAIGRELFDSDVYSFGTRAAVLNGLEQLIAEQWNPIWNITRGFTLLLGQMHCGIDGDLAWVAVPWKSQGCNQQDQWYDRHGRATYILERRGRRWLAVHSHHSLHPQRSAER